jgi:hypothetical protein
MTLKKHAELVLDADVDGDGSKESGRFVMAGNITIETAGRTGYLIGGRGSSINAVIQDATSDGESNRRGFFEDLGGGAFTVAINFNGWEGAQLDDGTDVQWGDDPNPGKTVASATGEHPLTQIAVFNKYYQTGTFDSRNPATLEYGEHHADGLYSALSVVIEEPGLTWHPPSEGGQDAGTYTGQLTCIAAAQADDLIDAVKRAL